MRRDWVLLCLDKALASLAAIDGGLTEQAVASCQRDLLSHLAAYLDDGATKKKKPEKITYRGLPLEIKVSSRHQHIDLGFLAFLKGTAAKNGDVPLFGPEAEAEVFGEVEQNSLHIDSALVAKTKASRDYAHMVLSKGTFNTAAAMQASL